MRQRLSLWVWLAVMMAPLGIASAETRFMHQPCDILRFTPAGITPEQLAKTGCALSKGGWVEAARCDDGQQWKYLMQKDKAFMMCEGRDALTGASEKSCVPFEGDIAAFNNRAECGKH